MLRCAIFTLAMWSVLSSRVVKKKRDDEGEVAGEYEGTCGKVFLLGVTSTWREARDAFISLCENDGGSQQACLKEEGDVFAKFPKGEEPFNEDEVLCSWLASRFAALADIAPVVDPLERPDGVLTGSSLVTQEVSSGRRRNRRRRSRSRYEERRRSPETQAQTWGCKLRIEWDRCTQWKGSCHYCQKSRRRRRGPQDKEPLPGGSLPGTQCDVKADDCKSKAIVCHAIAEEEGKLPEAKFEACQKCVQCAEQFEREWGASPPK